MGLGDAAGVQPRGSGTVFQEQFAVPCPRGDKDAALLTLGIGTREPASSGEGEVLQVVKASAGPGRPRASRPLPPRSPNCQGSRPSVTLLPRTLSLELKGRVPERRSPRCGAHTHSGQVSKRVTAHAGTFRSRNAQDGAAQRHRTWMSGCWGWGRRGRLRGSEGSGCLSWGAHTC